MVPLHGTALTELSAVHHTAPLGMSYKVNNPDPARGLSLTTILKRIGIDFIYSYTTIVDHL